MDKNQQLSSGEASSAHEELPNEANPTGKTLHTSLTLSSDSAVTDELCRAIGRLNVVDIQKADTIGIDQNEQNQSWDSLSGPPLENLENLLSNLRNDKDCKDVLNFSMVSPYYRSESNRFMKKPENRPGIKRLHLWPNRPVPGGFLLEIHLFRSNIPFYDLTDLDWGRFERVRVDKWGFKVGGEASEDYLPVLRVILSGPQDPAIEQVANLLSSIIHTVKIAQASLNCFTVAEQLLRNATIGHLIFRLAHFDDSTAPITLKIISHLKPGFNKLHVLAPTKSGLSDPESFVISLCEGVTSLRFIDFFRLPNAFWERFLNAKLSSDSVGWIRVDYAGKITDAPINIDPNRRFRCLNWGQNYNRYSWDSLSGPPLNSLLFHLFNNEELKDLNKFAMVSPFNCKEAKLFTKGAGNRPGIKRLTLLSCDEVTGDFLVIIHLFLSYTPFYDFTDLDWGRVERFNSDEACPTLRVMLSGPQDPVIEQLANVLSSTIQTVVITIASVNCLTVAEQLLRKATIGDLTLRRVDIDDTTAPIMLRIVSHLMHRANSLEVLFPNKTGLSDPESFITSLCDGVTSIHLMDRSPPFFGLPNSFWEKYLNAKLSSGSVGWNQLDYGVMITNTPIIIDPNRRLFQVKWGQADED